MTQNRSPQNLHLKLQSLVKAFLHSQLELFIELSAEELEDYAKKISVWSHEYANGDLSEDDFKYLLKLHNNVFKIRCKEAEMKALRSVEKLQHEIFQTVVQYYKTQFLPIPS